MNSTVVNEKYGYSKISSYVKHPLTYNRDLPLLDKKKIYIPEINNNTTAKVQAFGLNDPFDSPYLEMGNTANSEIIDEAEVCNNSGVIINATEPSLDNDIIYIGMRISKHNNSIIDNNVIVVEDGASISVVLDYTNSDDTAGYCNTATKLVVKKEAKARIVKIQRLGKGVVRHENVLTNIHESGSVEFINVELGGDYGEFNHQSNLLGDNSGFTLKTIYLGDNDNKLTFNYTANQHGKNTRSEIDCKGALLDSAKKVFSGKLDFKQGSNGSKGSEIEYVMMLDNTVKSTSIPILLCGEDDVEGEHAASAGQISDDKMMYLMSRGFDEAQAKLIIIEGAFNPVLDTIANEELRSEMIDTIKERLSDD